MLSEEEKGKLVQVGAVNALFEGKYKGERVAFLVNISDDEGTEGGSIISPIGILLTEDMLDFVADADGKGLSKLDD